MAYAVGTLAATSDITNTETVTIGAKVYTFEDSLTNVDGNVKVGADEDATLVNLKAAINLEAGAGTKYAALTTVHPDVAAISAAAGELVVRAKVDGSAANGIATTETANDAEWGAAALSGGTTSLSGSIRAILASEQMPASVYQRLLDLVDPEGDE
jgi:hypothetical protein